MTVQLEVIKFKDLVPILGIPRFVDVFGPNIPTIGASGAIFGILIAYGMSFPNRTVLLWFIVPVSARTLVAIAALMELVMTIQYHGGDGVARFAHLGGMLVGYLYLKRVCRWFVAQKIRKQQVSVSLVLRL